MAYHSKEAVLTIIIILLVGVTLGCAVITVIHVNDVENPEPKSNKVQQKKSPADETMRPSG
jgi:flagellar basal body-associated protein FliL